jgi:hypothetical protein
MCRKMNRMMYDCFRGKDWIKKTYNIPGTMMV